LSDQVCPNGHDNSGSAKFCGVCGASLAVLEPVAEEALITESVTVETAGGEQVSETVAMEETAASKEPPNVRKWLIIVGAAIAGVALIAGGAYFVTTTPAADVVGMSESQALAELKEQGLTGAVSDEAFSDTIPKGAIASQDPAAGSRLGSGDKVSLILSRGPARTVPNVEGDDISAATSSVETASLEASRVDEPSETVPEGQVISQSPSAGTDLEDGDTVTLVVSSGPPRTTLTYINDVSSTVREVSWATCSNAVSLWRIAYPSPVVQNQDKQQVSSIEGRWEASSQNGTYFPCYAIAKFPDTPTNEDEYRIVYLPSKAEDNRSRWITRSEMESEDWTLID
jgi:hypothetical protein